MTHKLVLSSVAVFAAEIIARQFISGPLDCIRASSDPELLYELTPGTYTSDGWLLRMPIVHIEVDPDGCRHNGPRAIPTRHPTVLFVGDSMTFGLGVENDDSVPALVEASMRK